MLHVYTYQSKETVLLEIAVGSSTMSVSHTIKYKCKAAPVQLKKEKNKTKTKPNKQTNKHINKQTKTRQRNNLIV